MSQNKELIMSGKLLDAINSNDFDTVRILLEFGAKPNAFITSDNKTPIEIAIKEGNTEIVEALLEYGADKETFITQYYIIPDLPSSGTPLHLAAACGRLNIVKVLLENGANIGIPNCDRETPLHLATRRGNLDIVKVLLENGANIEAISLYKEMTPLHFAARKGNLDIVKVLLENGANIKAPNDDRETPLHDAAACGRLNIVKFLLDNGANIEAPNYDRETPLHLAAACGKLNIVKFLLDNGANIGAANSDGATPLHDAAECGRLSIVKFLLKAGANIEALNEYGETPIFSAAFEGETDIIECLLKSGAKINKKSYDGKNILNHPDIPFEIIFTRVLSNVQGSLDLQEIAFSDNSFGTLLEIIKESNTITGIDISNITIAGEGTLNAIRKNLLEQAIDENNSILYVIDEGLELNLNARLQERQDSILEKLGLKDVVFNKQKQDIFDISPKLIDFLNKEFINKPWIKEILGKNSIEDIYVLLNNVPDSAAMAEKKVIIEHIQYKNYPLALKKLEKAESNSLKINYAELLYVYTSTEEPEDSSEKSLYNFILDYLIEKSSNIELTNVQEHIDELKEICFNKTPETTETTEEQMPEALGECQARNNTDFDPGPIL